MAFLDSEQALHDEAVGVAGSDDFGDPSYREALRVVLDSCDREAKFHEAGREATRANVVRQLVARLRSQQRLRRHPHSRDAAAAIRRPVIVLGLVRTGSTALHHLLAQDPQLQVLEYWLGAHPQPRPARDTWNSLAEFQESAAEIDAMYAFDPSLRRIHLMAPDLAEECRHLLAQSFVDDSFEVNATAPSYVRWYEGGDHTAAYRRHRELVGLIGADEPARRWLLKYPVHMKHLGALLAVYPDACIVQTHRDPARVLPSLCSLIAGWRGIYEDAPDRRAIAKWLVDLWADTMEDAMAARAELGEHRFFDVPFRETVGDPAGAVSKVYAHFGLEFPPQTETLLRDWHRTHPQHKHGEHRYSAADFGLDAGRMRERFARYIDRFGIELENAT